MEVFAACISGKSSATPYDVELYLRTYDGLVTACKRVNTENVLRKNAAIYLDILNKVKMEIKDPFYIDFLPFYLWVQSICIIVNSNIYARQEIIKQDEKEDEIRKLE